MQKQILINIENGKITSREDGGKNILGMKVYTSNKKYLGKVTEINFDEVLEVLKNITVTKTVFFVRSERIIPYENILEILKAKIIVKDDFGYIFDTASKKATLSLSDNAA